MKPYFSDQDIRENKLKAGLGYLVFFLPLVLCKDSKLGRHCANQGLLLLIAAGLVSVLLGIFAGKPAEKHWVTDKTVFPEQNRNLGRGTIFSNLQPF